MKKIFTLLTMVFMAIGVNAQTLIDFSKSQTNGITPGGSTTIDNVKLKTNSTATPGIKFANGYTTENTLNANNVKLTTEGGFKAGDVITIAGAFNNSDNSKKAAVDLFIKDAAEENGYKVLFTTQQFINGRLVDDNPVEETYTLEADADELYLGRNGNTATFVTTLKVVRGEVVAVDAVFSLSKSTIYPDEIAQIKVNDANGLDGLTMQNLSYDDEIISINAYGQITPKKTGTSTITFTTDAVEKKYNAGSANLSITVEERPVPDEIDYPTSRNGILLGTSCTYSTVKLKTNTTATDCINLSSGYTTESELNGNYITLVINDGFKAGDVVTIAGAFNNADDSKEAKIDIFAMDENESHGYKVLFTTDAFINGRTIEDMPAEQTYTLEQDADKLYLGRKGNTGTNITTLKVVRGSGTEGVTVLPVSIDNNGATYNLGGQHVNDSYHGVVIKNGKKIVKK